MAGALSTVQKRTCCVGSSNFSSAIFNFPRAELRPWTEFAGVLLSPVRLLSISPSSRSCTLSDTRHDVKTTTYKEHCTWRRQIDCRRWTVDQMMAVRSRDGEGLARFGDGLRFLWFSSFRTEHIAHSPIRRPIFDSHKYVLPLRGGGGADIGPAERRASAAFDVSRGVD